MKNLFLVLFSFFFLPLTWSQATQMTLSYQSTRLLAPTTGFEVGMLKQIKPRSWASASISQLYDRGDLSEQVEQLKPYYQIQFGQQYQLVRIGKRITGSFETGISTLIDRDGNLIKYKYNNYGYCGLGIRPGGCVLPDIYYLQSNRKKVRAGAYGQFDLALVLTQGFTLHTQASLVTYPGRARDLGWIYSPGWQIGVGYGWNKLSTGLN